MPVNRRPLLALLVSAALLLLAPSGAASAGSAAMGTRPAALAGSSQAAKSVKAVATLTASATTLPSGKVAVQVQSNAKKVTLQYRTSKNKKRSTTITVRKGAGHKTLARGSQPVRAYARATSKLRKSQWVGVSGAAAATPAVGGVYTIGPDSAILSPMDRYKTVNQYTRHYYLIRSYMHRFESAGGGTLVLRPGRYEISSTIFVPSNVTIQLSAGTTLVKSNQTGTSQFSPSASMFMLIRPSLGQVSHAVGGHNGDANITIAGAGGGQSVIDMAGIKDTLAIIAGHNRNVTIAGITFKHMNNNHFIEMDACADCVISGNEFLDAAAGTRETAEAINLDTPDPKTHGFSSVWSNQDATPNERVTIENNRFDGLQRAFGTHNFSAGRYHTDVIVRGNTLTNMRNDGIQIMNWLNPVFTGNSITASAGNYGINACGTKNPTITGNTFGSAAGAVRFRICSGENGTTDANQVSADNVAALKANAVGDGLAQASVSVPDFGTVWFAGYEPPPVPPSTPYITALQPGDGSVTVSWEAPWADERAPVTGYRIDLSTDGSTPIRTIELGAGDTRTVITGLTNGTAYYVMVTAHSAVGDSSSYPQGSVVPAPLPGVPTKVTGQSAGPGAVQINWTPPANTGGVSIDHYLVYAFADAAGTVPVAGSPVLGSPVLTDGYAGYLWGGLTTGQRIYVQVSAVNSTGEGAKTALTSVIAG